MATACEPIRLADTPPLKEQPRRWTPVRTAFFLTLGLRLVYSLIAAGFSPSLTLNPAQIARSTLTEHIMQRDPNPILYAILGVWERFDTLWYMQIARHGYDTAATVFYPLYPALIRLFSVITRSDLASALIVATLATFFLFWGALRLLELDLSPRTAFRALLLWVLWPDAFIFFAGYPESLLLAAIIWSLYFARRQRWGLAGTAACIAGLAKALGCLTALPLLYIGWKQRDRRSLIAAAASGAGTAAYQLWLRWGGFPSPSLVYAQYWHMVTLPPWSTLMVALRALAKGGDTLLVLNFAALASVTVLMFIRKVPVEYVIFSLAAILMVLTKGADMLLLGSIRYSLCAFAVYPALALRLDNNFGFVGVATSLTMLNLFLLRVYLDWGLVV